jgi:hypothetical protein
MKGENWFQARSWLLRAASVCLAMVLAGCTVDVLYREEEVTPVVEPAPAASVKAFPWPVLSELASIVETAPKAAIKEQVGYRRRMGLFRVEKAGLSESKVEKQGDDYKQERRKELR